MENIYPDVCASCCLYTAHIHHIFCSLKAHRQPQAWFSPPPSWKASSCEVFKVNFSMQPLNHPEPVAAKGRILVRSVGGDEYWSARCAWCCNRQVLYSGRTALRSLWKHFLHDIVRSRGTLRRGRGSFELWGGVCPLSDREVAAKTSCQPKSMLGASGSSPRKQ